MRAILVTIAALALAVPAAADGQLDLYGAFAEITEDDSEVGGGVRYSIGGTNWMFDLGITYLAVGHDLELDTSPPARDDLQVVPVELGARYLFRDQHTVRPYLGGGLSLMFTNLNDGYIDNGYGVYALGGLRIGRGHVGFMAEVVYRWAEVTVEVAPAGPAQIDIGGLGGAIGLSLRF